MLRNAPISFLQCLSLCFKEVTLFATLGKHFSTGMYENGASMQVIGWFDIAWKHQHPQISVRTTSDQTNQGNRRLVMEKPLLYVCKAKNAIDEFS